MATRRWVPLNNGEVGTRFTVPFYLTEDELVAIFAEWRGLRDDDVPPLRPLEAQRIVTQHLFGRGGLSFDVTEEDEVHVPWARETVKRVFHVPQ